MLQCIARSLNRVPRSLPTLHTLVPHPTMPVQALKAYQVKAKTADLRGSDFEGEVRTEGRYPRDCQCVCACACVVVWNRLSQHPSSPLQCYLTIHGYDGDTEELLMAAPGRSQCSFVRGEQSTFTVRGTDVGSYISYITVRLVRWL